MKYYFNKKHISMKSVSQQEEKNNCINDDSG